MRQIGPGMMQQVQGRCSDCHGAGETISDRFRCRACSGRKVVQQKKVLEVFVEKGMRAGQKIVFKEESDQSPDTTPGDIVVVLQVQRHPFFKRDGSHLYVEETISLKEALCGFEKDIKHFTNRRVKIRSRPGENVITHGDVKKVENEGMPVYKRPYVYGHLYVKFNVKYPNSRQMATHQLEALAKLLPGPNLPEESGEQTHQLLAFDPNEIDPATRTDKDASQEDDGDDPRAGMHGSNVQCAQQ